MNLVPLAGNVISGVIASGVGAVVGNVVKMSTPADLNKIQKFSVSVGSLAIGSFVAAGASKNTGEQITKTLDSINEIRELLKKKND